MRAEAEMMSIAGVIESVVYHNDDNDYSVLEIADAEGVLITAVGEIPMPAEGERVVLYGAYGYHKEYGRQFSFQSFEKTLPTECDDILKYLSSRTVKGVGPVTALKIVNRFGEDTLEVIESHPEWLADIPGITMKKAAAIAESFREMSGLRHLMSLCQGFMGTADATRIYKELGSEAVGKIRENPYILCEGGSSLPFEKADSLARSLGVSVDNEERIYSGLRYLLEYNANMSGHTALPEDKLVEGGAVLLSLPVDTVRHGLEAFVVEGRLSCYFDGEQRYIMTKEVDTAESYIAKRLSRLSDGVIRYSGSDIASLIEKVEGTLGIEYASLQREALYMALENGAMIITGGPGTGKTTVVKALLSIFNSLGLKTVLCAPTGRAAKRMSEATSEEAKTIHRMLEMERTGRDKIKFFRNERNPLDEKVVIVDEASMMDLFLTEALLRALGRNARLILIGDSNQLPSVGAGNILSDLLSSGAVRSVCLTEIFRQSNESLIVTNAHKIQKGEMPTLGVTDSDFFFLRREDESTIADTVASLITERLPRAYGRDIQGKIQLITPSKKGAGGVELLNSVLQERLNPKGKFKNEKETHGIVLREGDRVMQTVNNYEIEWEQRGCVGTGIFNGDIGTVESIKHAERSLTVRFDDRAATYAFEDLDQLELAYAITVHKSQGSEYPVVVVPLYATAPMLMTRNLLYTALTRAKRMVILVGRLDIIRRMVENNREVLRYTTLAKRISAMA